MIKLTHDEFRGGPNARPTNCTMCVGDRLHRLAYWHLHDTIAWHTDHDDDATDPVFDDDDRFAADGPIATAVILVFDTVGGTITTVGERRQVTIVMANLDDTTRTAHRFFSGHHITDGDNWEALTGVIADVRAGMGVVEIRSRVVA